MPELYIRINTDNDAFDEDFSRELKYVLEQVPRVTVKDGGKIKDSNGNTVGSVEVNESAITD